MSQSLTLDWAKECKDYAPLCKAVTDRLLNEDISGLSFGKWDEHQEDVVVQLLRKLLKNDWRYNAVVDGWRVAFNKVKLSNPNSKNYEETFTRVLRVAEREPMEFAREDIFSMLVRNMNRVGNGLSLQQIAACAGGFIPKGKEIGIWKSALTYEDIAGYAFQALLAAKEEVKISEISSYLDNLIVKVQDYEWDISIPWLIESVKVTLGEEEADKILQTIQQRYIDLVDAIKEYRKDKKYLIE